MYKITHAYVALFIHNIANFIVSISLEHFIESKSLISEECTTTTNSFLELVELDLVVTYHIILYYFLIYRKMNLSYPCFLDCRHSKLPCGPFCCSSIEDRLKVNFCCCSVDPSSFEIGTVKVCKKRTKHSLTYDSYYHSRQIKVKNWVLCWVKSSKIEQNRA